MNDQTAQAEPGAPLPAPPSSKPRPGFLRRHRATILTVGLVLYTIALGIAVCDDVFHLGLFPTALEREARGYIRQFDSPEESVRREAADKLVSLGDSFVTVPETIRALGSSSLHVRQMAIECLRRMTKAELAFDPAAPAAERRAEVAAWRKWWKENRDRF